MELQEYFNKIQSYKLSDTQKNDLYERILAKTQNSEKSFNYSRFYKKVLAYSIVFVLAGLSIYIPYLGQHNNPTNIENKVQADYIAKVVSVKGDYHIESNGNTIQGSDIADGDKVVLNENGSLVFHVNDSIEGKINGPATFIVHRRENGYDITLEKGEYIEVAAIGNQEEAPEVAVISLPHKFIAQTAAGKNFHFVVSQENEKPQVTNKADTTLLVANTTEENIKNETTTLLADNTKVNQGETIVISNIKDPLKVGTLIAAKTSSTQVATDTDYNDGFFKNLLQATQPQDDTINSTDLTTLSVESPTQDQVTTNTDNLDYKTFRDYITPEFIWVDLKYVTYYYLKGSRHEYQNSYKNLQNRLLTLYKALQLEVPNSISKTSYDLSNLTQLTNYLVNVIPPQVSNGQKNTLSTLTRVLEVLEQKPYGTYSDTNYTVEEMFAKIQ